MTETTSLPAEDAAAARALEQARIRKERREAKIKAGGTSRLNKISGLGGGIQRGMLFFWEPSGAFPAAEDSVATRTSL